jgi:GNAT superfamily N-acetyltransferase
MHRSFLLQVTPDSFRPCSGTAFSLQLAEADTWERCKSLWLGVGDGFWTARTRWAETRWREHLAESAVSFWIAREGRCDVGFFELVAQRHRTKLEGFGLMPALRGHGRGGSLLTAATRQAFRAGATRVWLHTATDDHPSALPNYLARGYVVYRERDLKNPMPMEAKGRSTQARSAA